MRIKRRGIDPGETVKKVHAGEVAARANGVATRFAGAADDDFELLKRARRQGCGCIATVGHILFACPILEKADAGRISNVIDRNMAHHLGGDTGLLVGLGLIDQQRRVLLPDLPQHGERVAMPRSDRHIQRAEQRLVDVLARGHNGDAVGAGRQVLVAADVQRVQISPG